METLSVQHTISKYFQEDQQIRKNPDSSLDQIRSFEAEFTDYLKQVIAEHGWVTISKFGEETSSQAGILVSHTQDKEFAQKCLELMEQNLEDINKSKFALIYDKVMLSADKPQKYGTKLRSYFKDDGQVVTEIMPLVDPDKVDEYRKEVGLGSLQEYIEPSEKMFLEVTNNGQNLKA